MSNRHVAVFPEVPQTVLDRAVELVLMVLEDPATPQQLAEYYDPAGDYAGHSFVALEPLDSKRLTAVDLLATSMLSIDFPASAVRRLLDDDVNQQKISHTLQALPEGPLEAATPTDFQAMSAFYASVKPLLSDSSSQTSDRWVAASKLVARKRPDLFPVRDQVVCEYLEIRKFRDYNKDWLVFRHLMQNQQIQDRLTALPAETIRAASDAQVVLDAEPLRILDAALWMHAAR